MVAARYGNMKRGVVAMLLAAALVPALGGGAGAISPLPITCTAAGTVVTTSMPDTWTLVGQGSCSGDLEGTYALSFTGLGTSQGLGQCSTPPGLPFVVTNLHINIVGTLTRLSDLTVKGLNQDWVAPITTYPVSTPFLVDDANSDLPGAGVFWNHIFLNCSGSTVATFQWTWLT